MFMFLLGLIFKNFRRVVQSVDDGIVPSVMYHSIVSKCGQFTLSLEWLAYPRITNTVVEFKIATGAYSDETSCVSLTLEKASGVTETIPLFNVSDGFLGAIELNSLRDFGQCLVLLEVPAIGKHTLVGFSGTAIADVFEFVDEVDSVKGGV